MIIITEAKALRDVWLHLQPPLHHNKKRLPKFPCRSG